MFSYFSGFTSLLLSEEHCIFNREHKNIYHDMHRPLSHYYIACSHNTWVSKYEREYKPAMVSQMVQNLKSQVTRYFWRYFNCDFQAEPNLTSLFALVLCSVWVIPWNVFSLIEHKWKGSKCFRSTDHTEMY